MNSIAKSLFLFFFLGFILMSCSHQKNESQEVQPAFTLSYSGAMRNVMHKGELFGTISLDTISNKTHLYGVGPLEYLKGEILLLDGTSYISKVTSDSTMEVTEAHGIKAPFFVYANISQWKEIPIPDSVLSMKQIEEYLNSTVTDLKRPFPFLIKARVSTAQIHVDNLPDGTVVQSPEDVRQHQITYTVPQNMEVRLVGFFSTEHKGIFTHHDSFLHIHLITEDKTMMGHVDSLELTAKLLGQAVTTHLFIPEATNASQ